MRCSKAGIALPSLQLFALCVYQCPLFVSLGEACFHWGKHWSAGVAKHVYGSPWHHLSSCTGLWLGFEVFAGMPTVSSFV